MKYTNINIYVYVKKKKEKKNLKYKNEFREWNLNRGVAVRLLSAYIWRPYGWKHFKYPCWLLKISVLVCGAPASIMIQEHLSCGAVDDLR